MAAVNVGAARTSGPFLPAEAFAQQGSELLCWSSAQRDALAQILGSVHRQWCHDWGIPVDPLALPRTETWACGSSAHLGDHETRQWLASALLGLGPGSDDGKRYGPMTQVWIGSVTGEAMADWYARLAKCTGVSSDAPHASVFISTDGKDAPGSAHAWSGALFVIFQTKTSAWQVRLAATHVAFTIGSMLERGVRHLEKPTADLARAMFALPVRLRASLSSVDMRFGQLQQLQLGDVVPLTHPLHEPLSIHLVPAPGTDTTEEPLCRGWLGQKGLHMAVQLEAARAP